MRMIRHQFELKIFCAVGAMLGLTQTCCNCAASVDPAKSPSLQLIDSGSGLLRSVTIESGGQFRLVFEASDNWGLDQWYDLVNDPKAMTNLLEAPGSAA
jgi:hypothetical protein